MHLDVVGRNEQGEGDCLCIGGLAGKQCHISDIAFCGGEEIVVDHNAQRLKGGHAHFLGGIQRKSCSMCIGADETSCTEFDPAKVAHDGDSCVCDSAGFDRLEDGASCRSARLAVIARTLSVGACAEYHRIGDVACLVVFLFYPLQPCAHILLVLRADGIGEEAGALNLIRNRGDTALRYLPCDGRVTTIPAHLFLRLK